MTEKGHPTEPIRKSSSPPTYDFVGEHGSIDGYGDVEALLQDFSNSVESGYFLRWEAVVREEQGLRLTTYQEDALHELVDFGDDPDDEIRYIDEIPRPLEPWHVVAKRIAELLLIEQLKTYESHYASATEGWPRLVECVMDPENGLTIPDGVPSAIDVVPTGLQHRLWLQSCFDPLLGIGQPTYREDPEIIRLKDQPDRAEGFIEMLREHKDTVEYLGLTLDTLLEALVMPKEDEEFFVAMMSKELGLDSRQDIISECL